MISGSSGSANNQFYNPSGLVRISSSGTLYIADTFNHRVMRYLSGASSGTVVAGGNGLGSSSSQLNYPYSFAFDSSSSSFLIANYGSHNVVRWVLSASSWTLIAGVTGSPGSTSRMFNAPLSVTLDPMGNMYVADTNNHRIQFFLAGQSNGSTIAGVTGSAGVSSVQLNTPYWAIVDNELNLFVADTFNHRVQKFQRY
jgi:sugar lactone lactonase YvrE